jgi:plasmid stability protein
MASLTIRKLDDDVKERLRVRAARAGHSMEEEARVILSKAVRGITGGELLALLGRLPPIEEGPELEIPPRKRWRPPPDFSE